MALDNDDDNWAAIVAERRRQEELRLAGKFEFTCADGIDPHRKLSVLTEEVGEVARALNDGSDVAHLREELVQVAAVCVAWLESLEGK